MEREHRAYGFDFATARERVARLAEQLEIAHRLLHDYRVDQGRIKQVGVSTLVLRELDGTDVTINISPAARIKLNGKNASFVQLRKGIMATTIHDGDKPADQVYATGK